MPVMKHNAEKQGDRARRRTTGSLPSPAGMRADGPLATLQRIAGNQAVTSLLRGDMPFSRPGDAHEQEADRAASRITNGPEASPIGPDPLDLSPYAGGLGRDLSPVRVHADPAASKLARAMNAEAFTIGRDVVMDAQRTTPGSHAGRALLAHELAHVVQQGYAPALPGAGRPAATVGTGASEPAIMRKELEKSSIGQIARDVHAAISGPGTDEERVYASLGRLQRDPDAIKQLQQRYLADYKVTLEEDIRDDFSGEELEYALQLINMGSPDTAQSVRNAPTSPAEYKASAKRIRDAVEIMGTDEEAIYAVLLPLNRDLDKIKLLSTAYFEDYKENLRDRIVDEMSSDELDYALRLMGENPTGAARESARDVLQFIQDTARKKAKSPPSIDPASNYFKRLSEFYLKEYLANPTAEEGKKAIDKIGRPLEGRRGAGGIEVRPEGEAWRAAKGRWEKGAVQFWNKQSVPELPADVRDLPLFENVKTLPRELTAATDVLIDENVAKMGYLDVPFLVGKANTDTSSLEADVIKGGKNISQLMHWATGVKYSDQSERAMRDLFIAYEMWHLEAWDVFGQDPINDLIAEESGRLLGVELAKGSAGAIKDTASLQAFLDQSFLEARAWVGALLRIRREELDQWILATAQPQAVFHWQTSDSHDVWRSDTVTQMLESGKTVEDVQKSSLVESQIEIYTLIFEADEYEKNLSPVGRIDVTPLQRSLVEGKLNAILRVMAKSEGGGSAPFSELLEAKSNLDDLKKGK
jgi:hypothetical protein